MPDQYTPRERGILFSAPMVKALLAGTKTQTRRAVKPQPVSGQGMVNAAYCGYPNLWLRDGHCDITDPTKEWRCPFGQVGDRLWVRESGARLPMRCPEDPDQPFIFRHDVPATEDIGHYWVQRTRRTGASYSTDCTRAQFLKGAGAKVVPSIHMPRWASRITLEITGVRVEHLGQISDADCWAEGAIARARPDEFSVHSVLGVDGKTYLSPRGAFHDLWTSTGGTWHTALWTWVVEFRVLGTTTTSKETPHAGND